MLAVVVAAQQPGKRVALRRRAVLERQVSELVLTCLSLPPPVRWPWSQPPWLLLRHRQVKQVKVLPLAGQAQVPIWKRLAAWRRVPLAQGPASPHRIRVRPSGHHRRECRRLDVLQTSR